MKRLDPKTTLLMIVDVQEKLARAMPGDVVPRLTKNAVTLLGKLRIGLNARVLVTEQYPQGLGPTIPELASAITPLAVTPMPKIHFDARSRKIRFTRSHSSSPRSGRHRRNGVLTCACFRRRDRSSIAASRRTLRPMLSRSRTEENRLNGLRLAERAGAFITNTETVVFDWLERAGTDEFRELSKRLR